MRAKRIDNNHKSIRNLLRAKGYEVIDTSAFGKGFPDLIVKKYQSVTFVEIKDGDKAKLTDAEIKMQAFLENTNIPYAIIRNSDDCHERF